MPGQKGDALESSAGAFSLTLTSGQRAGLDQFLELILAWNQRINLTGARTREELVSEHLPDSFAMSRLVPPDSTLIDVGAGGGLPAIPFAILRPDVPLTLAEPRAKRAAFLRTAIRELHLPRATVTSQRFDPRSAPASLFDVAASRATFPPAEWLEVARRLVKPNGLTLVFAAQASEVPAPVAAPLVSEISYTTGRRHPRWAAAFRFT